MNAKTKHQPLMAWHYTTGQKVPGIASAGFIYPADTLLAPNERPVAWFSLNPDFEPTAAKGLIDPQTGIRRTATVVEMFNLCGGLYRFGVPARGLLTGDALRLKARIPAHVWKGLILAGMESGADPKQWFGFVGAVELARCLVQRLNPETGAWEDFDPALLKGGAQ